jgi:hypothetical protein
MLRSLKFRKIGSKSSRTSKVVVDNGEIAGIQSKYSKHNVSSSSNEHEAPK